MIWGVSSAVALLIKSYLFFYSDVHKKKNFFIFLWLMFLLNLFELLSFFPITHNSTALRLYYFTVTFTAFYLAVVCAEISNSCIWINKHILLMIICIFSSAIFFTDYIVLDISILENGSFTRIPGSYYFIFQIYTISMLVFSLSLLIRKTISKKSKYLKARCIIALLAFFPLIFVFLSIISLMHLGYKINMVGLLSLATCLMLAILISLNNQHKLFTMMSWIPFSWERKNHLKMSKLFQQVNDLTEGQPVNMKELVKSFELLLIERARHKYPVQKDLARMLNISEGNLSRKIELLNKKHLGNNKE